MASTMLLKSLGFVVASSVSENMFVKDFVPSLYQPSPVLSVAPRAFGLVVMVLTGFSMWMLAFGMEVGKARGKYKELAEKDGEKDLERYEYPNLYVSGTSKHAKAFNATQRAHQHVLEVITQMYVATIICGLVYPLTTCITAFLWANGRSAWSNKYKDEGAENRYGHAMSIWIWQGLIMMYLLSFLVGFNLIAGHFF
mmetsp:Transcript_1873/g.2523  ORF Transcript_1873/g.2523 Transcript_1873/m.2523 type:complete len:197 (-) Transcript_1873:181-771(-)|eukprot:CAMPEP_0202455396 /NCGR_PEP_ID=MMETSP1360-20130828/12943_1 /ASSEMBLY_ACC=CAM_ASM_000848 /TAXON_ID=515479 /ORGANISM="Licmophora paradoxa, Strain CCMP2313" /LENGTH=196 /DNA_ID=CAMNT_0049074975 /DNA_START=45 /DNA_END=635 /DNA_ORIENTATION=+